MDRRRLFFNRLLNYDKSANDTSSKNQSSTFMHQARIYKALYQQSEHRGPQMGQMKGSINLQGWQLYKIGK